MGSYNISSSAHRPALAFTLTHVFAAIVTLFHYRIPEAIALETLKQRQRTYTRREKGNGEQMMIILFISSLSTLMRTSLPLTTPTLLSTGMDLRLP